METISALPYEYDIHDIAYKVNELVDAVNELIEQQSITWITGTDNCQIAVRNMPVDKMLKICAIMGDKDEEEED